MRTDRSRPDRPELSLAATLALVTRPDGTTAVDVNVEGKRVGALSAAETDKRVAVVQSVVEAGREPVAQLRLRSDDAFSRLTASLPCLAD